MAAHDFAYTSFTFSGWLSQNHSAIIYSPMSWSATPECMHSGLGSSPFARRYSGNRFFFLFLRLLRCFSSPAYLPYTMDSCMDTWSSSMWVAPFGNPRIDGYLLLPEAFRSLSRPSSAVSAKASALRPFCLLLNPVRPSVGYLGSSHISPRQREIWRQLMFSSGLKSSGSSPGLLRCPS